jgi:predicted DNA-binding transcriptional regulator YafY
MVIFGEKSYKSSNATHSVVTWELSIDMNKQKKFYTLLRQWKMLQLLPTRHPKDAAALRDELEDQGFKVDLRTVQRDLKELNEVFPITSVMGKPIAWRWDKHAKAFDVPGMDRIGAMTLKMVGEFMAKLLPQSCMESLAPNIRRAEAILEDLGEKSYGGWPDKVRVVPRTQPLQPPDVDPDILDDVYEALFKDRRLKAAYRKKGAEETVEYVVNPLGVVAADPVIYLVATLWDYDDVKLLAMHRFQSVEVMVEPVTKPNGFTLDKYLESGALGFAVTAGKMLKLKALFDRGAAAHLYESPLSESQTISDQGEKVLVEAEVLDTQQLRWWLQGFGAYVEVVSPKSLRKEFTEISRNMARCYEDLPGNP